MENPEKLTTCSSCPSIAIILASCNSLSLLLGSPDEVVPSHRRPQGPRSTRREAVRLSEPGTGRNRNDLGPIFFRDPTEEPVAGSRQFLRRYHWPDAAV